MQRVNSDLVGKIVNIASRCAGFVNRLSDGQLASTIDDEALWAAFSRAAPTIAEWYDSGEYGRAMREITALADQANQYIAKKEPWNLAKDPQRRADVLAVCTLGINLFKVLMVYLAPVLPDTVQRSLGFLNLEALRWDDAGTFLGANHRINAFEPLLTRIENEAVKKMIEETRGTVDMPASGAVPAAPVAQNLIDIDTFARIDLRVARVVSAEHIDGADKLLRLILDLGDSKRQVFAGIKSAYAPEALVGRLTVVVANLAPRKMRFGESQGMVLAAGPGGKEIFLLAPDAGAVPGMQVR